MVNRRNHESTNSDSNLFTLAKPFGTSNNRLVYPLTRRSSLSLQYHVTPYGALVEEVQEIAGSVTVTQQFFIERCAAPLYKSGLRNPVLSARMFLRAWAPNE
jgi:hypothetical protein